LYVEFHRDVPLAVGIAAVTQATGAEVAGRLRALNGAVLAVEPSALETMARLDEVKWIEAASPAFGELNDGVRQAIGVNTLQAAPLNIHGNGVTVLVYDGGIVCDTQPDLTPRVTGGESGFQSTHATHVAGTLGGNGLSSEGQYRGMAPAVDIVSYAYESCDPMCLYNNPQDLADNYAEGIALHDADFATNSIGANISANGYDCELLGDYENTARLIDAIARGALGRPFLSIWAAGNERSGFSPCGDLYYATGVPATAKSSIVVGATTSVDLSIADFSSLGPVDDGRMRPDLVAPGCELGGDGGVTSLRACAGHTVFCGTSMSTPAVAGVAALVLERLADSPRGTVTLPAAMKAILACSALDLGNPGPDYTFGYGQVDAVAAIGLVDGGIIIESEISQGETVVHTFVVPEEGIRVSAVVAWDDEPGEPLSFLNLVNDLDLRLVGPDSVIHRPFVLDPYQPGDLATPGLNRRDPSEMVDVDSRAGTWRVEVEGFSVPAGPQSFALAVYVPDAAPIAVASDDAVFQVARQLRLAQNVPNPFKPSTSIRFQAGGGRTTLRIFDLRGRLVRTLIDQSLPSGSHRAEWDGRDDGGRRVTSGVYLYALAEGGRSAQRRMVLVR
jgi:subtilisin family serine protease